MADDLAPRSNVSRDPATRALVVAAFIVAALLLVVAASRAQHRAPRFIPVPSRSAS